MISQAFPALLLQICINKDCPQLSCSETIATRGVTEKAYRMRGSARWQGYAAAAVVTPWILLVVLILPHGGTAQMQQAGSCPVVSSMTNFNIQQFMGTWYEQMHTARNSRQPGLQCSAHRFFQTSPANFEYDTYSFSSELDTVLHTRGAVALKDGADGTGFVLDVTENGESSPVSLLGTDYESYATLWSCIPSNTSHYENVVVLSRDRFPSLSSLLSALDTLALNNVSLGFLVYTEQRNCPDFAAAAYNPPTGYSAPSTSQDASSTSMSPSQFSGSTTVPPPGPTTPAASSSTPQPEPSTTAPTLPSSPIPQPEPSSTAPSLPTQSMAALPTLPTAVPSDSSGVSLIPPVIPNLPPGILSSVAPMISSMIPTIPSVTPPTLPSGLSTLVPGVPTLPSTVPTLPQWFITNYTVLSGSPSGPRADMPTSAGLPGVTPGSVPSTAVPQPAATISGHDGAPPAVTAQQQSSGSVTPAASVSTSAPVKASAPLTHSTVSLLCVMGVSSLLLMLLK